MALPRDEPGGESTSLLQRYRPGRTRGPACRGWGTADSGICWSRRGKWTIVGPLGISPCQRWTRNGCCSCHVALGVVWGCLLHSLKAPPCPPLAEGDPASLASRGQLMTDVSRVPTGVEFPETPRAVGTPPWWTTGCALSSLIWQICGGILTAERICLTDVRKCLGGSAKGGEQVPLRLRGCGRPWLMAWASIGDTARPGGTMPCLAERPCRPIFPGLVPCGQIPLEQRLRAAERRPRDCDHHLPTVMSDPGQRAGTRDSGRRKRLGRDDWQLGEAQRDLPGQNWPISELAALPHSRECSLHNADHSYVFLRCGAGAAWAREPRLRSTVSIGPFFTPGTPS